MITMKVAIPTLSENSNLKSEIADCPRSAKSLYIYDLDNEVGISISVKHVEDEPCGNMSQLEEHGVTDFVSGECCREHFDLYQKYGITVWKITGNHVKDMINGFVLGGAFIRKWKDTKDRHPESTIQ